MAVATYVLHHDLLVKRSPWPLSPIERLADSTRTPITSHNIISLKSFHPLLLADLYIHPRRLRALSNANNPMLKLHFNQALCALEAMAIHNLHHITQRHDGHSVLVICDARQVEIDDLFEPFRAIAAPAYRREARYRTGAEIGEDAGAAEDARRGNPVLCGPETRVQVRPCLEDEGRNGPLREEKGEEESTRAGTNYDYLGGFRVSRGRRCPPWVLGLSPWLTFSKALLGALCSAILRYDCTNF